MKENHSTCFAYKESSRLWTPGSSLCNLWTQNSRYLMTSCVSFLHFKIVDIIKKNSWTHHFWIKHWKDWKCNFECAVLCMRFTWITHHCRNQFPWVQILCSHPWLHSFICIEGNKVWRKFILHKTINIDKCILYLSKEIEKVRPKQNNSIKTQEEPDRIKTKILSYPKSLWLNLTWRSTDTEGFWSTSRALFASPCWIKNEQNRKNSKRETA